MSLLPTKYEPNTPCGFQDTAKTRLFPPPTCLIQCKPVQPDAIGEKYTAQHLKAVG